MTNMQAAIGVAQLERLDEFVLRKRRMGTRYAERLTNLDGLQLPLRATAYAQNIYWVFGLVISDTSNRFYVRWVSFVMFLCQSQKSYMRRDFIYLVASLLLMIRWIQFVTLFSRCSHE